MFILTDSRRAPVSGIGFGFACPHAFDMSGVRTLAGSKNDQ